MKSLAFTPWMALPAPAPPVVAIGSAPHDSNLRPPDRDSLEGASRTVSGRSDYPAERSLQRGATGRPTAGRAVTSSAAPVGGG